MARKRTLVIAGAALAALATAGAAFGFNTDEEEGGNQTTAVQQPEEDCVTPTPKDTDTAEAEKAAADALRGTGLSAPPEWDVVNVRAERHDDTPVTIVRYQDDGCRLGAPQSSVVFDAEGTVLGFTRLAEPADGAKPPGDGESEEIALEFLDRVAPRYAEGLSVEWADRHDEIVTSAGGDAVTVSGTKVKMHHDNGRYSWVVVGANGEILTYERDITWDSEQGRRGTQMWLHDSWIAARDGVGEQPGAPYARADS